MSLVYMYQTHPAYINLTLISGLSGMDIQKKNPLIVSRVTITNGGYGYNTPEDIVVDFSEPDLSFGQKPIAHVELVGDAISKVIIDTNGYGYTKAPTITITGNGIRFHWASSDDKIKSIY